MRVILLVSLMFAITTSYSQEEFLGINSGLAIQSSLGFSGNELLALHQSQSNVGCGISFVTKPKIIGGAAIVSSETDYSIGFMLGYQGDIKEKFLVIYPQIGVELFTSADYYSYGLHGGGSLVFFEDASFPFSIGASLSAFQIVSTNWYHAKEAFILTHLFFNQAIMAKNRVYPVVGVSISTSGNQQSLMSFAVGINFRINREKRAHKLFLESNDFTELK